MKILLTLLLVIQVETILAEITFSQDPNDFSTKEIEKKLAPQLFSFSQAAKWADLVAIAQVDDIEYEQVRKLNAKGYAFLDILVAYKGATRGESIAVIATGFDDNICYYPDRENAGERFLVFLKKAPNDKSNVYYGFKPYCQLQILLSELGQYILRTPLDDNIFPLEQNDIKEHKFKDPHAMIDTTLWTSTKRDQYIEDYQCKFIESNDDFNRFFHLRYTQGIPIYKIRPKLELTPKPRITSKQI